MQINRGSQPDAASRLGSVGFSVRFLKVIPDSQFNINYILGTEVDKNFLDPS